MTDYLFLASNLALHLLQQKATVLPSLPLAVILASASLPLMGHLSAAAAMLPVAMTRRVSSVFIGRDELDLEL